MSLMMYNYFIVRLFIMCVFLCFRKNIVWGLNNEYDLGIIYRVMKIVTYIILVVLEDFVKILKSL